MVLGLSLQCTRPFRGNSSWSQSTHSTWSSSPAPCFQHLRHHAPTMTSILRASSVAMLTPAYRFRRPLMRRPVPVSAGCPTPPLHPVIAGSRPICVYPRSRPWVSTLTSRDARPPAVKRVSTENSERMHRPAAMHEPESHSRYSRLKCLSQDAKPGERKMLLLLYMMLQEEEQFLLSYTMLHCRSWIPYGCHPARQIGAAAKARRCTVSTPPRRALHRRKGSQFRQRVTSSHIREWCH